MWDDEVGLVQRTQAIPRKYFECEMIMVNLREYVKDIGKEVGTEIDKEFGVEFSSKNLEKMKKKLIMEKNKNHWLIIALVVSWILFSIFVKLM